MPLGETIETVLSLEPFVAIVDEAVKPTNGGLQLSRDL